jgi:hypothetical protein
MKRSLIITRAALLGAILVSTDACTFSSGRTFFSPRSQSVNAARELVGWYWSINRYAVDDFYGSLSGTFEYTQTFQARHIARYFFGTDILNFTGSRVPNRSPNDILADYFGLPTDFNSVVLFSPSAQDALLDIDWYCGLDAWYDGIYIRAHAPIVYTKWDMNIEECSEYAGVLNYPAGYMADALISRNQMSKSVTQSMTGAVKFGDLKPLRYGKIDGSQHRVGLSEIQVAFGWNMVNNERYHFGINARTSIPTGNRPRGTYMFEPIIGNGHHWELGVGFTGHALTWYCDDEWMVGIYGDANFTHLFNTAQRRSFDFLKHGSGSRYILLQEMGTPAQPGFAVDEIQAQYEYQGSIFPAINFTTLDCVINAAIQMDLAVMITWQHAHMNIDIGYNLWARTAEHVSSRACFPDNRFAFKGDAQIYGFVPTTNQPIALNATQSTYTQGGMLGRVSVESGQVNNGSASGTFNNANADNIGSAMFDGAMLNQSYAPAGIVDTGLTDADIGSVSASNTPVLLGNDDIDDYSAVCGSAATNKFFFNAEYTFGDRLHVTPYIGLGCEIELDGAATRIAQNSFSQWGIWMKTGFAY